MLKKFLAGVLCAVMLALSPLSGFAITDVGRSEVSRIWASTDEGSRFACTATYIQPYISDYGAWIISAGHCTVADTAARNQSESIRGVINWRGVINTHGEYGTQVIDIAVGTVPDVRKGEHKYIWLEDKAPEQGTVYIHGFPAGVERVNVGYVAPEWANERVSLLVQDMSEGFPQIVRKNLKELLPGGRFMLVKKGEIVGGSSGSPILNGGDRLVGILWGVIPGDPQREIQGLPSTFAEGYDIVLWTPVERVHELFKSLGVDG